MNLRIRHCEMNYVFNINPLLANGPVLSSFDLKVRRDHEKYPMSP